MRIVDGGKKLWEPRPWSRDIRQFLDDVDAKLASMERAERECWWIPVAHPHHHGLPMAVDFAVKHYFEVLDGNGEVMLY